jgi:hypothetical protein
MEHPANFLLGDMDGLVRLARLLAIEGQVIVVEALGPEGQTKIGRGVLIPNAEHPKD